VRVSYSVRPGNDGIAYRSLPEAETRHVARRVEDVQTFINTNPEASGPGTAVANTNQLDLADRYMVLMAASPRVVNFTSRGKLADLKVADLITINRVRGLDATGALVSVKFRIVSLNFHDSAGIARCTAIEYIPLPP